VSVGPRVEVLDRTRPRSHAWVIVVLGVGALLLRTRLFAFAPSERALVFAAVAGSILVASVLVPVPRERVAARLPWWLGLAIGLFAVRLATAASGPPVPLSFVAGAVPLSILAAVAEEALFRRVAYGWLERWGVPVAIVGSALLFALIHVPLYGAAVFPVDLGAGLLFSWQRWATGNWGVPAATHAAANTLMTVLR
jgi:membrane protease YdiL (CAAX protease family)